MLSDEYVNKRIMPKIMHKCVSQDINEAKKEWEVVIHKTYNEDIKGNIKGGYYATKNTKCVCRVPIKYNFEIKNKLNNNIVRPIGSCCILKFLPDEHRKLEMNSISTGLARLHPIFKCIRCGNPHKKRTNPIDRLCKKCENNKITEQDYLHREKDNLCKIGKYYNRTYEWIYKVDIRYFQLILIRKIKDSKAIEYNNR